MSLYPVKEVDGFGQVWCGPFRWRPGRGTLSLPGTTARVFDRVGIIVGRQRDGKWWPVPSATVAERAVMDGATCSPTVLVERLNAIPHRAAS